jgi:sensor histidine kinase regulating citrate/malate metabolism
MTASETPKVTEIQLAAMLDKVSSGIYAVDPDWRFSFINQARRCGPTVASICGPPRSTAALP